MCSTKQKTKSKVPISAATRQNVQQVADELKYYPNAHARRFFKNKAETIGLLIPPPAQIKGLSYTFHESLLAELLSGIEAELTERRYKLMITVVGNGFLKNKEHLDLVLPSQYCNYFNTFASEKI